VAEARVSSNPFVAAFALRHQGPCLIPIEAAHHDEMTNLSAASPQIQKQGRLRALKSREERGGLGGSEFGDLYRQIDDQTPKGR
jgi:hypothetical protein